ncbi:MAG: YbjN domain-containing protein [Gemmatimonadota bacterium]|nr:YbjN domain-containing protein [Gemmatimonadota bacterium]
MITQDDLESFLLRADLEHEEVGEGMWAVAGAGADGVRIIVNHSPPLLIFRVKVLDVPDSERRCAELYRRLLELNATDLVHGAYGIEGEDVILTETLELENLDFSEFQATIDSFGMALAGHLEELAPFRTC